MQSYPLITATVGRRHPIVDFERNPNLKGLEHLNALYDIIASRQTVCINYRSFIIGKSKEDGSMQSVKSGGLPEGAGGERGFVAGA